MQDPTQKNDEIDPCACESVCSLPPDRQQQRSRELRETLLPLVRSHSWERGRVTWELDYTTDTRRLLEDFVEFERACCASLDFRIEPTQRSLKMTICGEGAELFRIDGAQDSAR